jgi:hypothetical protein
MISRRIKYLLLSVILLAPACATQQEPNDDLSGGFIPLERNSAALVGPLKQDRAAFERIKDLEDSGALGTLEGTRELRAALRGASQTMLAATAPSLFRAGVYSGSPELIDISCESMRRVTHAGLRRSNGLGQYEQACDALGGNAPSGGCQSVQKLVAAYQSLRLGDEKKARQEAAAGLREQGLCSSSKPLVRTPVAPESRGFMIVVALQAMSMPPATYLANEPAPRTADAINAAFAHNARMIKNGES